MAHAVASFTSVTARVSAKTSSLRGKTLSKAKVTPNRASKRIAMSARAEINLLGDSDKKPLVDSVETFIFDCDGVIWKGDSLIEGVKETIAMLRGMGKRLIFVRPRISQILHVFPHKTQN